MTLQELVNCIQLKDDEIQKLLKLLKKFGRKGYCVLWYHKTCKEPLTLTIYDTETEAKTKIKEVLEQEKFFINAKIIKL